MPQLKAQGCGIAGGNFSGAGLWDESSTKAQTKLETKLNETKLSCRESVQRSLPYVTSIGMVKECQDFPGNSRSLSGKSMIFDSQ